MSTIWEVLVCHFALAEPSAAALFVAFVLAHSAIRRQCEKDETDRVQSSHYKKLRLEKFFFERTMTPRQ